MTSLPRTSPAAPELEPLDPWLFARIAGSMITEVLIGNIRDGHRLPRRALADLPALRAIAHRSIDASFDLLEDELRADRWRARRPQPHPPLWIVPASRSRRR